MIDVEEPQRKRGYRIRVYVDALTLDRRGPTLSPKQRARRKGWAPMASTFR